MKLNVYAYKDIQVNAFQRPWYDLTPVEALKVVIARQVATMKPEEVEKNHIADLDLYFIGVFDDETGHIVTKPEFLLHLDQYVEKGEAKNEQSVQDRPQEAA